MSVRCPSGVRPQCYKIIFLLYKLAPNGRFETPTVNNRLWGVPVHETKVFYPFEREASEASLSASYYNTSFKINTYLPEILLKNLIFGEIFVNAFLVFSIANYHHT